jgi:hypothetical protein
LNPELDGWRESGETLTTGHFAGWVAPAVCTALGIAGNAAEAWAEHGGGAFDRKPPKGESAKEFARGMLKKNPNAYFYRHNMPGEDTWAGDWSEEAGLTHCATPPHAPR